MSTDAPEKLSPVEGFKTESHFLRGSIGDELVDETDHFGKSSIQLLKHHGTYQQDDRDDRGGEGGKTYSFMVRTAIPGGKLSSKQLLAELDLCDEVGNTTLRITTRQGLQLHGVLKSNLRHTIRRINDIQLTTIAACGDVERNVMASPCPYKGDPVYDQMQDLADRLARHLRPRTRAYYELWLSDEATGFREKVAHGGGEDVEPIYGPTYLPRKFKTGIGLPSDNIVDLYSQDLGLLAIAEDYNVVGYNVLVGGGFGLTPSAEKTYAALAQPLCFVTPDQVIDVAEAIIKVQRDFGNRSDRKVARMKYLIHNWGLDRFKQKVEEYYGGELAPPRDVAVKELDDGMGWRAQGDGRYFYGLNVENGRIKDEGDYRLKSALRKICRTFDVPLRLTPHQSIIFCDLAEDALPQLVEILKRHGVPTTEDTTAVRRWAMACPALPTCGLAITESERILPTFIDELEPVIAELGLSDEVFTTRMTGCPNGCARPYNSDIGLVGKTKEKYTIYLGGRRQGDRLNFVYRDLVPTADVAPTLARVLRHYREARTPGESLGDFCHRVGKDELLARCEA